MKALLAIVSIFASVQSFAATNTSGLSCLLYTGGAGIALSQADSDTLTATSKGTTITIYSMGDSSFSHFQAVLNVPGLSDIRAYGTKDSLNALGGSVVGYLNHSRMDEISVSCEVSR